MYLSSTWLRLQFKFLLSFILLESVILLVCYFCKFRAFIANLYILSLFPQESVKTKHPQLHYESKLYMLLQGGSKFPFLVLLSIVS